jgi:hypothetical protein
VPKILRRLQIGEVSSVDAGANQYARVLIRKRNGGAMQTVTKRQVADALRKASYADLEQIAKRLVPGVDGKIAMHRAGSIVPGWNGLLTRCLAMAKRHGAAHNPQEYGGGDATPAREPLVSVHDEDGYDALSEWNASVSRLQRQMKLPTRSAAVDAAMKDSGARAHLERAKAFGQVPG